jgi:hypothetical protein
MNHSLTYSILAHLKTQVTAVSNRVTWIYDGVTLTGTVKPFLTIQPIIDGSTLNAAGRTSYTEVYTWQVGIFARNTTERARISEAVRTALRQPTITFINTTGATPVTTAVKLALDVGATTPIPVEDVNDTTNAHKAYVDVSITIMRENAGGVNFTQ